MVLIKKSVLFVILFICIGCNKRAMQLEMQLGKCELRESVLHLYKNLTKIDSLKFKNWYCNAKIRKFDSTKKLCQYNFVGGSGINLKNQFLVSINNDKIIQNLNIELYYKESVLGDSTFKKSFKRKTTILKTADDNIIYLKRTCFKNDIQYYYKMVKLNFDKENQIYCNKIIKYKNEFAKGIELDSSSYNLFKSKMV